MDYKSDVFTDGWLKDLYGATPPFISTESNPVSIDNFCTGTISQYPTFGHYEDTNPTYIRRIESLENEDYFSWKSHSTKHLSPPSTSKGSLPPSIKALPMKVTKRKPGRPRTVCPCEAASTLSASSTSTSVRIPHNQVERKYRHSLNAEMARLRVAIPKISEWDTDPKATLKPSKAMVLASAVSYIQELERTGCFEMAAVLFVMYGGRDMYPAWRVL